MIQPQHIGELLRERLHRALVAAKQITDADPILGVAELLDRFGLAHVELRAGDCELVDERKYTTRVPDRFVPDRTVIAQRKDYQVAVPFDGDPQIIRTLLGNCSHSPQWEVTDIELRATFTVDPQKPAQEVRAEIDARIADAAKHIARGQAALTKYRVDLHKLVTVMVAQVCAAHDAGERQRDGLGIPVRAAPQPVPSVPAPPVQRVPVSGTIDDELDDLFERVMEVTRYIGHALEAFTSLTNQLSREEHTRDVMIFYLQGVIPECDFTAETQHGQGKNDIHVRYKGRVVCVIELKKWDNEKDFKDGIDQVLSYLTVRDSRVAVVLLIRIQDVTSVIEKTKRWLLEHANSHDQAMPDDKWRSDFRFHATGDPARPIKMVYMPFAFATSATGASTRRGLRGVATR